MLEMADISDRQKRENRFREGLLAAWLFLRKRLVKLLAAGLSLSLIPSEWWRELYNIVRRVVGVEIAKTFIASAIVHGMAKAVAVAQSVFYAVVRAAFVARSFVNTTAKLIAGGIRRILSALRPGAAAGEVQITELIESVLGDNRADVVAVTETTVAVSAGGEAGMGSLGLRADQDIWLTQNDERVCPICQPLHRVRRSEWSRHVWSGPPAHARCRCHVVYKHLVNGKVNPMWSLLTGFTESVAA